MRPKSNKVFLTPKQRDTLQEIVTNGKHPAKKIRRANILLLLDENHPPVKKQKEIAEICHTSETTVRTVAQQFSKQGLDSLNRKKRAEPPIKPIVTSEVEDHILAINRSAPPEGHSRWTLSLMAKRLIELNVVPTISRDTVGRALKKRLKATSK